MDCTLQIFLDDRWVDCAQIELNGGLCLTIDDVAVRSAEFKEMMSAHGMLGTGTTGVQGAAPKYLLTRDRAGLLRGDAILPDADATQHLIAKLPRGNSAADDKVLRNEAAYMRVAAALGIRTHADLPTLHGDVLLVPRFDRIARDGKVMRLHQESVASILGLPGFDQRPSLFEVVAGIRKVVSDPAAETLEFIKRDVLNLAMRNTDNHARNTAVQLVEGRVQLTPLFDFAPMYLDPELIPRALRWYRPDTRAELTDWTDVLAALPVPDHERRMLAAELSRFAVQIERLPDIMAAQGVDHDIIEFLTQDIDTQARQLKALQPLEA
jgi:serine/threonine-protein kinase HipA